MNFTQKSFISIFGKFFAAFLGLVSSIILARILGPIGVGKYQLMITSQTIAITILAMGFGNATIYFVNNLKNDLTTVVTNTFKIYSLVSCITVIIYLFMLYINDNYFGNYSFKTILIFSFGTGALLLYNILLPILYIKLEVIKIQLINIISSFIQIISLLIYLYLDLLEIDSVLIIIGICNIISLSILIVSVKKYIDLTKRLDYNLIKKIFIYGIKISATNLVFILSSNIVIFILKINNNFSEVGIYSRAIAIVNIFILIPNSIGPLLYSKWANIESNRLRNEVENTMRILIFSAIICIIFIIIFSKSIILVLYGDEFLEASGSLIILSIGLLFSTITLILTNLFSSIGKPIMILKTFLISLLLTTIFSLVLIPKLGINGASLSVLIGLIYNAIALIIYSKKFVSLNILNILLIKRTDFKLFKKLLIKK